MDNLKSACPTVRRLEDTVQSMNETQLTSSLLDVAPTKMMKADSQVPALVLEMVLALMTMKMADSQVPALVLMKELVLVLVMVQLQAMNDSLASKPKPLVANFQPHVTQEHSTKRHPQRSYLAPPLAQIRSQPRYQKTVIQAPNAPAYKGGGISLQRELLGSVIDPNQSVHSESESTPPFFSSQRLLPGSLGCPSFPNCVRNPLWGPRDPGSC
ncbi:MAG: hypothetical protein OIF55_12025, partial [Amphritea sp.]|nr:hypothetical protein [Amphritea sp.]